MKTVIRAIPVICVISGAVLLAGCVPALIGAVAYKSSKTRQAKQAFMEDFNQTNIEREKAGLAPLDLCTEKYSFDKKWADDDPVCAERIARYEAGDRKALGNPQLPQQATTPEKPGEQSPESVAEPHGGGA